MASAAAAPSARASCLATFKGVVDFVRAVTAQMEDVDRAQVIERQVAHMKMIVRRGGCARDDATQTVNAINATDILTATQKRELITAVTESVTMDIAMTGKRDGRNFNVQYQTHHYPEHYLTTEMWALLQDPHLGVEAKLDKVGEYFVHTLGLHYPDQKTVPRLAALVVASEIAAGREPTPAQAFEYKNQLKDSTSTSHSTSNARPPHRAPMSQHRGRGLYGQDQEETVVEEEEEATSISPIPTAPSFSVHIAISRFRAKVFSALLAIQGPQPDDPTPPRAPHGATCSRLGARWGSRAAQRSISRRNVH